MMTVRETGVCYRKDKHNYESRNYDKPFKCDGCKEQGCGLRYRCDHCGHELHKECFSPEAEISYEFFGACSFKFFEEPQPVWEEEKCMIKTRCCDACGNDIRGYNYHCKIKDWDLHPCCRNLPKKRIIDETIFEIQERVSSKCIWCNQKDIRGLSYVSTCGNYHFHVYCVMKLLNGAEERYGNLSLENINLHQLAKSNGVGGRRHRGKYWSMAKLFLEVLLSILLGNPTAIFSGALVELLIPA